MIATLLAHLRQQWIGVIALLLVLTGGTAYALDGSNTVFTDDIVNGDVKNDDLGANSVGSGKIADGAVHNEDVGGGAITSNKVADQTLTSDDVADNTLTNLDLGVNSVGPLELSGGAFRPEDIKAQFSGFSKAYGIPPNAIQSDEISNGTVQRVDLAAEATGPAGFSVFKNDTGLMCNSGLCTEGTLAALPAGSYVIFAKIIVEAANAGEPMSPTCRLVAGVDSDLARVWQEGATLDIDTLPMQVVHTFTSTGSAAVECGDADVGNATGSALKITAVRLGSLSNVGL